MPRQSKGQWGDGHPPHPPGSPSSLDRYSSPHLYAQQLWLALGSPASAKNRMAATGPSTRGLHSSTFQLNLSASCGIGGACRRCLQGVQGVSRVIQGVSGV